MVKAGRRPGRPPASSIEAPTSDRILQVASDLFMRLGYEGTSTDDVAHHAGVTKAMIYYYFSSKSSLFTAAVVRLMDTVRRRTIAILQRDEPLYDRLLSVATGRLSIVRPVADFQMVMRTGQNVLSAEQLEEIRLAEERIMEVLATEFRSAAEQNVLCNIDPMLLARLFAQLLTAGEHHLSSVPEGDADPRKVAKDLMDVLWSGIHKA